MTPVSVQLCYIYKESCPVMLYLQRKLRSQLAAAEEEYKQYSITDNREVVFISQKRLCEHCLEELPAVPTPCWGPNI